MRSENACYKEIKLSVKCANVSIYVDVNILQDSLLKSRQRNIYELNIFIIQSLIMTEHQLFRL